MMPIARISAWVAMVCKSPEFWRFLQVDDEPAAIQKVRTLCGVASRSEFDSSPEAAARLHELVRKPFIDFTNNQEHHDV